jgi:hypothetical protein
MVVHHYPDSARQGQVLRLCARRGTRAVNKHGTSVWHPSPKIRVNTVWPEAGKEAGHVAVSSLRKLSSGGTATPTAILLSSCRVSTSLTTYQGSWLGPSPCVAASYGKGRGCTTADRLVENGGQHQWGEEKTPSQPLQRARSHTGHLGPFGVPAALLRPHMVPAVIHITTEPLLPLLPSEDSPSDKDSVWLCNRLSASYKFAITIHKSLSPLTGLTPQRPMSAELSAVCQANSAALIK